MRKRTHARHAAGTPRRSHPRRKPRELSDRRDLPAHDIGLAEAALAQVLALDVVRESASSRLPADRLLKARLRDSRLSQGAAALVVRLVFSWFRWRGFLNGAEPAPETVRRAGELAERYLSEPERFDPVALLDGAVPGWLRQHMEVHEGFVRTLQDEPTMWLRARPGGARELAAQLPDAEAGVWKDLPDAVRYRGTDDLFRSALFNQGRFEIQDVASQAVGVVCAPAPGETWWDACAGEGGKTLHLADLMRNRGLIWASDRSIARLGVLRKRAARAGLFNYRTVAWDGGARPPTRTAFDGVLVDAPCSGVGTWQRNPHARWTVSPADVRELAAVQQRLLHTAATGVKAGGRLIYAVCTLTRDETDAVAATFTREHPEFEPAGFADPFHPGRPAAPQVSWEPQITGGNGMFVAAWRRVSR